MLVGNNDAGESLAISIAMRMRQYDAGHIVR
jgi:ABC-type enterochelin transport system ATPase subunit